MSRSTDTRRIDGGAAFRRPSRRVFLSSAAAAVIGGLPASPALAGQAAAAGQPASVTATDLGGVWIFRGPAWNVLALPGPDGALMIDGGDAARAEALLASVRGSTRASRIHTLVNTHGHQDQVGANEAVGRAGGVIIGHEKTLQYLSNPVESVEFKGRRPPLPQPARPTRTVRGDGSMEWPAPGERGESRGQQINYGYLPAAHTDGDLFLHMPQLNLLAAGGVVSADHWPLVDYRNGAWLGGRVRAVDRLAGLVRPDTRVVPARGPVMTGADVVRHRDIYTRLFETMIEYMNKGRGPEDAVELNPLKQYQGEFGDPSAFLYGAMRSMMIAYVPD
jgi:cyclase